MKMPRRFPFSTTSRLLSTTLGFLLILSLSPLATPSGPHATALPQQAADQDCEKIKKDIQELQQELADLSAEMQNETNQLNSLDKTISQAQAHLKSITAGVNSGILNETLRGEELDTLAKLLSLRKQLKQQLEDDAELIQEIKAEIADLLNKLGSCPPKQTQELPKEKPKTEQSSMGQSTTPKSVRVSLPGYQVGSEVASGLRTTTFTTPQGTIKVDLTDDLAASDTITGTVEAEPEGKTDQDRARNMAVLEGYVVEFAGQKTTVASKTIQRTIPSTPTSETSTLTLAHNGQTVASTQIPIATTPPPAPAQITIPTGGQQGHTLELDGPSSGVVSPNDSVKIGEATLSPIAKGPRKLVVRNTSEVLGPTKIEWKENGATTECPFRNLGIKLSAPLLNLLRGQTTTLTTEVLGLAGITEDVPLTLANNSPTVISMSGGNAQSLLIHPAEVTAAGTYLKQSTLTGIQRGAFGITGTVTWKNVCTTPAPKSAIQ